jgi:hypothetical protein
MSQQNNTDKLIVYHGTTSLIDTIDVALGKPYKDFGRGFYVTENYAHAQNLAIRNKRLEQERGNKKCPAYVYTYVLDMIKANDFAIKKFAVADLEWMRFVLANRSVREKNHQYDIVIGATANDDTSLVLKSYFSGLYGDVESERVLTLALDMIEAENLPSQIYFGTNEATECLAQKGAVRKV